MVKTKKDNGQAALIDEMQAPVGTLPLVELPSGHHYAITRVAISERVDALKKLAGKVEDDGYVKEGKVILGDALALEEEVLPHFTAQAELPLTTAADVSSAIKSALRGTIFKHVQANDDDAIDHRAALADEIGGKLGPFVIAVAARAFRAGEILRHHTPEAAAAACFDLLWQD